MNADRSVTANQKTFASQLDDYIEFPSKSQGDSFFKRSKFNQTAKDTKNLYTNQNQSQNQINQNLIPQIVQGNKYKGNSNRSISVIKNLLNDQKNKDSIKNEYIFDSKLKADSQINMSKTFYHKRMNHSIIPDGAKLLLNDYQNQQNDKHQNEISSLNSGFKQTNIDSERRQLRAGSSIGNDRMNEISNSIFNSNTDRFQSQRALTPSKSTSQQVFKKDEKIQFCLPGYQIAQPYYNHKSNINILDWKATVKQGKGKQTYLDEIMKISKQKISPQQYATQQDWNMMSANKSIHGHDKKLKFYPGSRITIPAEEMRIQKKKNIPAPSAYNNLPKPNHLGLAKSTVPQLSFYEDCKQKSLLVPGSKYDCDKGLLLIKPKIFYPKIYAEKEVKDKYKLLKSKDPDMGSYNEVEAFKKTQLQGYELKIFLSKSPKKCFIDYALKSKKGVPAPGHYNLKQIDSGHRRLSQSPVSIRIKRH